MTSRRRAWGAVAAIVAIGAGGVLWAWPGRAPDPLAIARDAYDRGDWKRAEAQARAVLITRKDDPDALRLLARASGRQGQDDTAKRIFQRLRAEAMQPEDNLILALALIREGRRNDAKEALQFVLQDQRDHPEARRELAKIALDEGRPGDAAYLLEPLTKNPAWDVRADVLLGLARDQAHDPVGAIAPLEHAIGRDPELKGADRSPADVRKLLARALLKAHRPIEAKTQLQAVPASSLDLEAWWLMSRASLQAGDIPAANEALARSGSDASRPFDDREPAPYVGAASCAECHKGIHHTQQSSRHAQTFRRAEERPDLVLPATPLPDPHDPKVIHTLERLGGRIEATTRVGDQKLHDVIAFILGSGDRAFTLVGRDDDGTYREHRLSYYDHGGLWDVTTGHTPVPGDPHEFLGQAQSGDSIHTCLNCHTTNFRAIFDKTGPEAADHAIGCERCHGPAGNHLAAVASSFPDPAIGRPRLGSSEAVTQLCGQCHGLGDRPIPPNNPSFLLRFQATTLPMSRCVQKSEGNLSCVTCHSPHRDAEKSARFYEAKCLACHGPESSPASPHAMTISSHATPRLPATARRVTCPVNPSQGCISCHMPPATGPMPHSTFTDHEIRVHRKKSAP
ncbi:MAG: hypothetical protein JWN86_1939 [Planctomycetota bacterium]|nr:hypothetical protein [Planctomycetota bacterium]